MCNQRGFDLGCAHAVTGYVDHVVDAACDPIVAICVTTAAVAREVVVLVVCEIRLLETLVVAPDGAHLTRPAVFDRQNALGREFVDLFACGRFQNNRLNAKERLHCSARLGRVRTRKRSHQVTTGFCLPPCVNDRAVTLADNGVVPVPCLGVDGLAHGTQNAQIGQIAFGDELFALTHQRADRGGGSVELVHLVLFAHLPEAACVGVGGNTFEHQRDAAIGQRAVDDIAVACDPTHVSGTPVDVAIMVIEGHFVCQRGICQVATCSVHNALGLTSRTGCVQNEQRVFCVHLGRRAVGARLGCHGVVVEVTTVNPCGLTACAFHHQTLHIVIAVQQGLVRVCFQRCLTTAARCFVCCDNDLGVTPLNTGGQSVGREAGKNDRVDRADTGTGQHRIGSFRDHREINDNAVTAFDTQGLQNVRHTADAAMQFLVGDVLSSFFRIIGFPDDRCLIAACRKVAVDTVGRDVQRTVFKPFDRDIAGCKRRVLDLGRFFDPVDAFRDVAPETFRIRNRTRIHFIVFCGVHMCLGLHVVTGRVCCGHLTVLLMRSPFGPPIREMLYIKGRRPAPPTFWQF